MLLTSLGKVISRNSEQLKLLRSESPEVRPHEPKRKHGIDRGLMLRRYRVDQAFGDRLDDFLKPVLDLRHVGFRPLVPCTPRTKQDVLRPSRALLDPEHVEHGHAPALIDKPLYAAHGKDMLLARQLLFVLRQRFFRLAPFTLRRQHREWLSRQRERRSHYGGCAAA